MISTLIFLLGPDPDDPIVWGTIDDGRLIDHGSVPNAEAISSLAGTAASCGTVAAVLHGEDVAARMLASPPRGDGKLLAAARYLLEDDLAESLDGLHIAVARTESGARVAAIRAEIIDRWLAVFRAAGIALDALLVDYLALPWSKDAGTLVLRDVRAIAGFDGVGFAAEAALVCGDRADDFFGAERRFAALADPAQWRLLSFRARTDHIGAADEQNLLLIFAKAAADPGRLNLLQGRFRRRTPWRAVAAPWRRAAMLAGFAVAAALLAILSDGAKEARTAAKWEAASKLAHTGAFPGVPAEQAVANARKRLAEGGGRTFSRVTSIVGKAAEEAGTVEVSRIRFDAAGSEYFISVRSTTDSDIEAFKKRLVTAGVSATDNGGYRRIGEFWAGEFIVRSK